MPTWPITSIRELLEPTLNHMGFELYALEQSGQSGRTLRVSIDHAEPITIEDCERVSRVAGPLLDNSRLIEDPTTSRFPRLGLSGRCAATQTMSDSMANGSTSATA